MALPPWTRELFSGSFDDVAKRLQNTDTLRELQTHARHLGSTIRFRARFVVPRDLGFELVQQLAARFFVADRPVAAICHCHSFGRLTSTPSRSLSQRQNATASNQLT